MTVSCPTCGRYVNAGARFCGGCGSPLAAMPMADAAPASPFAPSAMPVAAATEGKGFSIARMLKFGWHTTWDNFGPVVGVFALGILIYLVIYLVPLYLLSTTDGSTAVLLLLIWSLLILVALAVLVLGCCKVALRWADGGRGTVADLFDVFPRVLSFIGATILYCLIVFGGLLLFVIPGIVWAMTFSMYPFLIVDKGLGLVESLKASARVTSGAKWDLFALILILQYVLIAGLYALGIGLFVAVPVTALAYAMAYRWMEQRTLAA